MEPESPIGPAKPPLEDTDRRLRRMSRRGFAAGGAAVLAAFGAWRWVGTWSTDDGVLWPLRRMLRFNERVARATFRANSRSPQFAVARAAMPRVNGRYGIKTALDSAAWRLRVVGVRGERSFSLDEIRALPRYEMTTELKCIEGWSTIVHWTGARLADLAQISGLATRSGGEPDLKSRPDDVLPYASLTTPDAEYYVGLDIASALHPQTLLCYAMGGEPLTAGHGAPLRLAIPLKYGIKNIKRIGTIQFTAERPADYWAERGYDWYAGH